MKCVIKEKVTATIKAQVYDGPTLVAVRADIFINEVHVCDVVLKPAPHHGRLAVHGKPEDWCPDLDILKFLLRDTKILVSSFGEDFDNRGFDLAVIKTVTDAVRKANWVASGDIIVDALGAEWVAQGITNGVCYYDQWAKGEYNCFIPYFKDGTQNKNFQLLTTE